MKIFNVSIRSWMILLLIASNVSVVQGQDELAQQFNSSLSDFLRNVFKTIASLFRRPKPPPIQAPVKAPVKVPTPVVAPKAVPVSVPNVAPVAVPTPKVVPVPVPKVAPVAVPVSIPKAVPVRIPVALPVRTPTKNPIVVAPVSAPKSVPIVLPLPIPIPSPVAAPVSAPKSVPVVRPLPVPVPVLFVTPVSTPKSVPVVRPLPVPVPKPVVTPVSAPKSVPVVLSPPASAPKSSPINNPIVMTPKAAPVVAPLPIAPQITVLYTHGDAPYAPDQAIRLEAQMKSVPADAEFIVFVGDLRKAGDALTCRREEYEAVARLFRFSPVPVFVLIGDNDANDCPNIADGLQYWNDNFLNFESRYWNHTFFIRRQDGYPDNFSFTHKKSLFVGLNIIGGLTRDTIEWEVRLSAEAMWTINMIRDYLTVLRQTGEGNVGRIVIFGHADPGGRHAPFFQPIATFIENELKNQVPVLYVNGDKHEWTYTPSFYGKSSWLRIGVEGLATDPLLKVTIDGNGNAVDPVQAFVIDRRL